MNVSYTPNLMTLLMALAVIFGSWLDAVPTYNISAIEFPISSNLIYMPFLTISKALAIDTGRLY